MVHPSLSRALLNVKLRNERGVLLSAERRETATCFLALCFY